MSKDHQTKPQQEQTTKADDKATELQIPFAPADGMTVSTHTSDTDAEESAEPEPSNDPPTTEAPAQPGSMPSEQRVARYIQLRNSLVDQIESMHELVYAYPPESAELDLALRHLQDARMRLGVAMTIAKGENPYQRN